ncbi:MAG: hypothetical protein KGO47_08675 [Cyanobacteria bacterium REEB417]|nr:hypothetical protein [Cyanobacteria bacterium REEB417]
MPTRSPSLRLIQGIAVAIDSRDATATQQGLRVLASVEPEQGESMLRALTNAISPTDRYWLANLDGPRRGRAA